MNPTIGPMSPEFTQGAKTAKFTPGPWKVSEIFLNNEPNHAAVHQMAWGGEIIADLGTAGEYNNADALLIAAAPELLEACKHSAKSCHHPACKCHGEYTAYPQHCTCHVEKARAAIAKAESQQ